jgi:hypothetical protein
MAKGKVKDDDDQVDGVAEGADEGQFDGVAEGIANPDDDGAAKEQDDSKAKGFGKSRADKTKQEDVAEDQDFGKKGKSSKK